MGIRIANVTGTPWESIPERGTTMRKGSLLTVGAFVFGLASFAAPSASEAVVISQISVTVGGVTWCDTTTACLNQIWNLTGGVNLPTAGNSLVVTQTGTGGLGGAFNFDTSDRFGNPMGGIATCTLVNPCTTSLSINGVAQTLGGGNVNVLADNNLDSGGTHNEFHDWNGVVADTGLGGFRVWFGYADNVHGPVGGVAPCAPNCLPSTPFANATTFIGQGAGATGVCTSNCFDAGAIRIEANGPAPAIPEPASLLLLGTGLMLGGGVARRQVVDRIKSAVRSLKL